MMSAKQKNVCNECLSKINFFKWIVINHYLTDFNQSLNFPNKIEIPRTTKGQFAASKY